MENIEYDDYKERFIRKRATRKETKERKSYIMSLIIEGWPSHKIISECQPMYKCSEAHIRTMMSEALQKLKKRRVKDRDLQIEKEILKLEKLQEKAAGKKDYKLELEIRKEINKLKNLYTNEIELNLNGQIEIKFGEDDSNDSK